MSGNRRRPEASARLTTYQLELRLARPVRCRVGALGLCVFPAGRYRYTGSARAALEARIARHQARTKRIRWHIDYLLAQPGVRIVAVHRSALAECRLCQTTGGRIVVPGFGASDCRSGCGAHLTWHPSRPNGTPHLRRGSAPSAPRRGRVRDAATATRRPAG